MTSAYERELGRELTVVAAFGAVQAAPAIGRIAIGVALLAPQLWTARCAGSPTRSSAWSALRR